jgi:hypothetical protein
MVEVTPATSAAHHGKLLDKFLALATRRSRSISKGIGSLTAPATCYALPAGEGFYCLSCFLSLLFLSSLCCCCITFG